MNSEENRVQIIFNDKPDADIRSVLKQNGFRWAPSQGAWQRILNEDGICAARQVTEAWMTTEIEQTIDKEPESEIDAPAPSLWSHQMK